MPRLFGRSGGSSLRVRRAVSVSLIVAIVAAKLWLIHSHDIAGSATRHDALWFVRSAKVWYWWANYDWSAFVRPPAYPLWLALVQASGIRQRVAIELLQTAGFLTLALGLIRAGLPRSVGLVAFAAMCFHPLALALNNYTMADSLYAAVLPLAVGAMLFVLVGGRTVAAVCCGLSVAVLWCTRAESALAALLLIALILLSIGRRYADGRSWSRALTGSAIPLSVTVTVCAALLFVVYRTNQRTFRAFAKSDMDSPSFTAAFDALVRIKPERVYRFVPVPKESIDRAFAVSPEFAKLQRAFDFESGTAWRIGSLADTGVQDEIRIDLLLWAIRNAAEERRIHATPKRAERFYRTVARQINQALDEGKIESRSLWAGFIGPNLFREAHHLPNSLRRVLALFVGQYETAMPRDDEDLLPEERSLYDEMTLRRPLDTLPHGGLRHAVQACLAAWHRWLVVLLAAGGAVAAVVLCTQPRRFRPSDPLVAALLLMLVAVASRIVLFTVIDATSWPAAFERFLFPVMPMASAFLIALIYQGLSVFRDMHSPDA